jgi:hypothetical protein
MLYYCATVLAPRVPADSSFFASGTDLGAIVVVSNDTSHESISLTLKVH